MLENRLKKLSVMITCLTTVTLASLAVHAFDLKKVIKAPSVSSATSGTPAASVGKSAEDIGWEKVIAYTKEVQKYIYTNYHGKPYQSSLKSISDYLGSPYYATEPAVTSWLIDKPDWDRYCALVEVRSLYDYQTKTHTLDTAFSNMREDEKCKKK